MSRLQYVHILTSLAFVLVTSGGLFFDIPFTLGPLGPDQTYDLIAIALWIMLSGIVFFYSAHHKVGVWGHTFFTLSLGLVLVGFGIHLVANHFNDDLFLIHNITGELKNTAYYYDETLSHFLQFLGYFGLIVSLITVSIGKSDLVVKKHPLFVLFAILHGLFLSLASLEGQVGAMMLLLTVTLVGYILTQIAANHVSFKHNATLIYYSVIAFTTFLLLAIWLVAFQGFPEPSAVGLL